MDDVVRIGLKDFIYIGIYVVSFVGLLAGFRYKIKKVEDSNVNMKNIIFEEKGGLNIVSNKSCKERRQSIHDIIDREAGITSNAIDKIDNLSANIHILMGAQGLEPIKFIKKEQKKTFYQCKE